MIHADIYVCVMVDTGKMDMENPRAFLTDLHIRGYSNKI
jgi:hypothetical protein